MKIRGTEVLLPTTAINAFPRPHWLQGRILGTLTEPVYRSHNLRIAYEDAVKLCALEQELAGLDILCDGAQFYEWEAPGFQLEPIFHFVPENLAGFTPYGPPGDGVKYAPFYKPIVEGPIEWKRPMFESVVNAMKLATTKPFKVAFLGPAQQSVIVDNQFYKDNVEVAFAIAHAMNKELKALVAMGMESVQLIDVLAPYTQDMWQIEVQNILFDGVDAVKMWHICYGSVDGQRDVFEAKTREMIPLWEASPVDVIHVETCSPEFGDLSPYKDFPKDKILGLGVVDAKNYMVDSVDTIADRIRARLDIVGPDRLLVAPDCGLGYFSRSAAYGKLRNMGEAVRIVREEIGG